MEELVPICVNKTEIHTASGVFVKDNVRYYNVVVRKCPPYVALADTSLGFVRASPITRLKHHDEFLHQHGLTWPEHPINKNGDHIGAIIILQSLDNHILFLRNGMLWGLPKGVRNYSAFHDLKSECIKSFNIHGNIPVTEKLILDHIETASDNICRETLEETGITLDPSKLIAWHTQENCAYTRFVYKLNFIAEDYTALLTSNGTDHENDEIRWIELSEINEMLCRHKMYRYNKVFNHVTFLFLSQYLKNITP